jgi:uncharacterized protein YbcC (UPF0753/DUF2309 family)
MNHVSHATRATTEFSEAEQIRSFIEHATHYLPTQGPIKVFVHHNTLHAFEDLNFEDGVLAGLQLFGCEPYFSEERYREEVSRGRIRMEDIEAVLEEDLGDEADRLVANAGTRYALRLAMLRFPMNSLPDRELQWMLAESDALWRFRDEVPSVVAQKVIASTRSVVRSQLDTAPALKLANFQSDDLHDFATESSNRWSEANWEAYTLHSLWRICRDKMQLASGQPDATNTTRVSALGRHRDLLARATGADSDALVNDVLIRFTAAYLDQGFAAWEMPSRDAGLLRSFIRLYASHAAAQPNWMNGLSFELRRLRSREVDPFESIIDSLNQLGVATEERQSFIESTLLALRGWAGMVWQMETSAPWTPRPAKPGSLVEFLAVRLMLDRHAIAFVALEKLGINDLSKVRATAALHCREICESTNSTAFTIFQIAQACGYTPDQLKDLNAFQWKQLAAEVTDFNSLQRRRILHLAYERKYRNAALDAVKIHSAVRMERLAKRPPQSASFQVITCIDDREESFRRHLEEIAPACATFGAAGFFAVVMYYRGAAEAHYRPLCPINIVPKHYVIEEPVFSAVDENEKRSQRRRLIGHFSQRVHSGSRTIIGGLITGVFGSLATFPLVARVLAPHITARIRSSVGGLVAPPATELHLQRETPNPGPEFESLGYTIAEMAGIVVRILQDIGLVEDFSPFVLFLGHGSNSLNNPHESAYNCGACSGGRGGPNARAFAWMANDSQVRKLVSEAGINIPDNVRFIGGYHNTCNDRVEYYDLDQLPHSHRKLFRDMEASINEARQRNALERARRFESAPLSLTPAEALQHVEERSEDLSQARPEYNHATNAMCFVGQREWSRGLFLDRRAFLASYDPSIDTVDGKIVERILQAAIPVCGGISLEYYFSTVDPEGHGCGSKLPHNITSLAGVMTGAASDLRPGLSAQMTEIHEPLRILFVVQTNPTIMKRIIAANPAIESLVVRQWVQLALLDTSTSEILVYRDGEFESYEGQSNELPIVSSSTDWFRGSREHLGFASIIDNRNGAKVPTNRQVVIE